MIFAKNFARNYEKISTWNIRRLVDESFVPATQRPSALYWRLSDFWLKLMSIPHHIKKHPLWSRKLGKTAWHIKYAFANFKASWPSGQSCMMIGSKEGWNMKRNMLTTSDSIFYFFKPHLSKSKTCFEILVKKSFRWHLETLKNQIGSIFKLNVKKLCQISKKIKLIVGNVCHVKIRSRLQNNSFRTISSNFFANDMNIFHKK